MPVDPDLQALLDAQPAAPVLPAPWPAHGQPDAEWRTEVARARAGFEELMGAAAGVPEVADVRDAEVPVAGGSVSVRVYAPHGEGPHPAIVVLHGGGFWIGGGLAGMAAADGGCRLMCAEVGAIVVNVDYRQAPEHRFPTALEDAWAATAWTASLPEVDPDRVAVNGASAGANLAAGVARLSLARGPRLRLQQLLVPTLDATLGSPSTVECGYGTDLTYDDLVRCWQLYLGTDVARADELVSPLLASDLSGLPQAHIVVGEHDPLRDDGLLYADRLRAAGVAVRCDRYPMTHFTATPDVGGRYVSAVLEALTHALAR